MSDFMFDLSLARMDRIKKLEGENNKWKFIACISLALNAYLLAHIWLFS